MERHVMRRNRRKRNGTEDVQIFRALIEGTPPSIEYLRRAVALQLEKRFAEAALEYRQALRLDPDNPFALNNYGFRLLRLGVVEDAHQPVRCAVEFAR